MKIKFYSQDGKFCNDVEKGFALMEELGLKFDFVNGRLEVEQNRRSYDGNIHAVIVNAADNDDVPAVLPPDEEYRLQVYSNYISGGE